MKMNCLSATKKYSFIKIITKQFPDLPFSFHLCCIFFISMEACWNRGSEKIRPWSCWFLSVFSYGIYVTEWDLGYGHPFLHCGGLSRSRSWLKKEQNLN